MKWVDGTGIGLDRGTLAWVEHPRHGVVWAELDSYQELQGEVETTRWTWGAYGVATAEVLHAEEITRYWVIEKPDARSPYVSREELRAALRKIGDAQQFGDVSGMCRWLAEQLK